MKTGKCIKDTANEIVKGSDWGSLSDVELVTNCLDPASQFRFRENGAMLNLERQGCLTAYFKSRIGGHFDMFFIYVDAGHLDRYACAQKPSLDIYRVLTQTSGGALSQCYKGGNPRTYAARCAEPKSDRKLAKHGLDPYIAATTSCNYSPNRIFNFGKFYNFLFYLIRHSNIYINLKNQRRSMVLTVRQFGQAMQVSNHYNYSFLWKLIVFTVYRVYKKRRHLKINR